MGVLSPSYLIFLISLYCLGNIFPFFQGLFMFVLIATIVWRISDHLELIRLRRLEPTIKRITIFNYLDIVILVGIFICEVLCRHLTN